VSFEALHGEIVAVVVCWPLAASVFSRPVPRGRPRTHRRSASRREAATARPMTRRARSTVSSGSARRRPTSGTTRQLLARALDVFGDAWTFLVMQEAFFGVHRFVDFDGRANTKVH